jgi:hypothetical protein
MSITGNLERDARLTRAIKECPAFHEQPTIENVRGHLPKDFDLLEEELDAALLTLRLDGEAAPESVGDDAPADNSRVALASPQAYVPDAEISQTQARQMVEQAHKRLGNARVAVQLAQQKHRDTKATLASAIEAWQRNADPMSNEQRQALEHRNYLASEQERKQRLANAGMRPTKMRTDKFPAQAMGTGGPTGAKGNTRGAYPHNFQHRTVGKPSELHGKLPSER